MPTQQPARHLLDPKRSGNESARLREELHRLIVGQDEPLDQIINVYQRCVSGFCPSGRTIGNFLFLGPTGSGKTKTVEAVAQALLGNERAVTKIDCAEFSHSHEIAKLIGSPPGYLGHRETHPLLSQEVINQHHTDKVKISFVLFDEIEKASDSLWNLLLGILDKATLTLGDNRKVDFSKCMIFMTSNLGAREMAELTEKGLGFKPHHAVKTLQREISPDSDWNKMKSLATNAAKRKFQPEFMNRIDKIAVFKRLELPALRRILDLELAQVYKMMLGAAKGAFIFTVSPRAKEFILAQGYEPKYGARHLKRSIDHLLVQPISALVESGQVKTGDWILADMADTTSDSLTFWREADSLSTVNMAAIASSELNLAA